MQATAKQAPVAVEMSSQCVLDTAPQSLIAAGMNMPFYDKRPEVSFSGIEASVRPLSGVVHQRPRLASYDVHDKDFFDSILISEYMDDSDQN